MTGKQPWRYRVAWRLAVPFWWAAHHVLVPLHDRIVRWGERD